MQEFLPLQVLRVSFKTDIAKLHFSSKDDRTALYSAVTSFGDMTLIVETVSHPPLLQALHRRNHLIAKRQLTTPLVYEQEVVRVREDLAFCLTLTEPIQLCKPAQLQLDQSAFEGLVRCAHSAAAAGLSYESDYLRLKRTMRAEHNCCLFMDFTRLVSETKTGEALEDFKSALCALMHHARSERMQEVLFICSSPFLFDLHAIAACRSWFDLAMLFNLLHQEKLTVTTESRTKTLPVNKLSGPTKVHYQGEQYNFVFREGFRMDGVAELTLQQLKNQFFEEGTVYHMTKEKYMTVRKSPADRSLWPSRIEAQDLIYVRPQISKVQFINFLIGYMRFIEPLLHQIAFHVDENALELAFTNKLGKQRRIVIKFHPKYLVKDEELSMVIEKSRMKNASVSLNGMAIGDSFLIFLANCDKMAHIRALDVSKCTKITESALNLLLASPFCKALAVLKINGLPLPDLQVIRSRGQLKELEINDCVWEEGDEVHVHQLSIQRLEALGVPLHLKFNQNITHLCLTHDVPLEQLKAFKHLPLVSLKIRIVEHRKTIGSFFNTFNNLYSKDNPVKLFAEGACRRTLKLLDVSHSTIKIKEIRPIIAIQSLQSLICEGLQKDRLSDLSLPHHILVLSLKGSRINAQQVQELTQRINFFIRLSLLHTDVTEKTLETAIRGKKYINLLEVAEEQVFGKFFSKKSAVEGVALHLHKLLRDDNQPLLNSLLFSQLSVCKELNLHCDTKHELKLAQKVHRFLTLYQENLRGIAELTLTINAVPVAKLLPLSNIRDTPCEYFTIVSSRSAPHRLKLNAGTVLAQEYRLAVTEQHLGSNLFNVALHKVLHLYPESLLEVSIRNNRFLAASAITLLRKYAGDRLIALDFRNCLFSYAEVQQQLYEFQHLQSVNEGEYEISLNEEDACEQQLQKILKFFLKLRLQEKMKLKLKAHAISERELFFSILFEILHHHAPHIISVQINFQDVTADHQAEPFWHKLFLLQKLEHLKVRYINYWATEEESENSLAVQFQKLTNLSLFSLDLQTSIHLIIPTQLSLKDLKRLSISYAGMEINEQVVAKLLKSTPNLSRLTLALPSCPHLTSVGKISDALQRLPSLTHFSFNIQNSPVRQTSLFQLIEALHRNPLLECFELNANNSLLDINQLAKLCQALVQRVRFCRVFLFVMQARRPAFFRSQAELQGNGIQLVFST